MIPARLKNPIQKFCCYFCLFILFYFNLGGRGGGGEEHLVCFDLLTLLFPVLFSSLLSKTSRVSKAGNVSSMQSHGIAFHVRDPLSVLTSR